MTRRTALELLAAARALGVPLIILDLTKERLDELYEARLALLRPDQIVCWRGDRLPSDPGSLLAQVTGRNPVAADRTAGAPEDQRFAPVPGQER